MHYHPDLAAALAETRTADLHDGAARGRPAAGESDAPQRQRPPSVASIQLDAYPRLCGLPVTIERVAINRATQADAAGVSQGEPESPNESTTTAAQTHGRRRGRLLGRSKRNSFDRDHDRAYYAPQGGDHPGPSAMRKPEGSSL